MAPTLSRNQLTAALVLVTLIPFGLVVLLYMTMPDTPDPVLDAEVTVGPRAWPNDHALNARMVPCAIVRNPTRDEWNRVNLMINAQFDYSYPKPVRGGEEIFVPLKFFHAKGNRFYPPQSQELKQLTIFAQIPSGARAILDLHGEQIKRTDPRTQNPIDH